jgi:hypothetical protein
MRVQSEVRIKALKARNSTAQGESGEAAETLGYDLITNEAL